MEATPTWPAGLIAIVTAVTGLLGGGVLNNLYKTWKDGRAAAKAADVVEWKDVNDEYRTRLAAVETEFRAYRAETDLRAAAAYAREVAAADREHACELKFERVYTYMRYLAGLCAQGNIVPMTFDPGGSAHHAPLPAPPPVAKDSRTGP